MEEARQRLITVLPLILLHLEMAKISAGQTGARVELATIVKNPDGSGMVASAFENGEEFLQDIARALGYQDISDLVAKTDVELEEEENKTSVPVSESP